MVLGTVLSDLMDQLKLGIDAMIADIVPTIGLIIVAGLAIYGIFVGIRLVKKAFGNVAK